MTKKLLLIVAHPDLASSRLNQILVNAAQEISEVHIHDLYKNYPDFKIDVPREQKLLTEHDAIVFQFPLYWYSSPALLKEWQDVVLQWGFAFGEKGTTLKGKKFFCAITTGGADFTFQTGGKAGYTMHEFLRPIEQTMKICHMNYEDPFLVQGSNRLSEHDLALKAEGFKLRLRSALDQSV